MTKLTLISITFRQNSLSEFHQCKTVSGKTVVPQSIINQMLDKLGCTQRGQTYSIG